MSWWWWRWWPWWWRWSSSSYSSHPTGSQCVVSLADKCLMYNGLRWDCSSGGSRGENHPPTPHPFFYQNEAQRAKKHFLGDRALPLSQDLDDCPPPPPYLKVWICHCADWWKKHWIMKRMIFFITVIISHAFK